MHLSVFGSATVLCLAASVTFCLFMYFAFNRYVQYNQTTLERNFKFDLLTEHDLGVPIDLINPDTYMDTNGKNEFLVDN
jgi:Paf1